MSGITKEKRLIEKAKDVHHSKYDYSKVNYINAKTKVCIICPEHGEFWQKPSMHVLQKQNCPKCALINTSENRRKTKEQFVEKAKQIHGDKYDYSKVEYCSLSV